MLQIREIQKGEEVRAVELVEEVFTKFIAPGYISEGIREFGSYIAPQALKKRIRAGSHAVFLALDGVKIVGVLELRDYAHISLLFVAESYQGQGLAGKLLNYALGRIVLGHPGQRILTVNSSPNARFTYEKLGFRATAPEQEIRGIRFIPMEYPLR